ncbi:phospholipid-binding protein MlaC [Pelagibius sp.]|uniref:MlaC/ttg2D family ABC transporter substrate-binding protein n=1 Tax=Pelagibius sp. TaxID=1931238 RepID=UPI0026087C68|nr:ABC transporter substrate-binding protein [Pelagibius sp.]
MTDRIVRPLLALVFVFVLAGAAADGAAAFNDQQAAQFLSDLQERAAAELSDGSISDDVKEERFRSLFNQSFDVPAIGRFVLGRYWRGASPQDRDAFLNVFEDVIVQRFLPLLTENTDRRFVIGTITPIKDRDDMAFINSQVPRAEGEPYKVSWRVREKEGRFKILDIRAEGVSMAQTLRSEYGTVIKRNGGKLNALTEALREKVAGGAFAPRQ